MLPLTFDTILRAVTTVLTFPLRTFAKPGPGVLDQIAALESSNSSLLRYPTQFTQGIVPKAIHSHNDYWRDVPLLTALSYGVASVEADVWLINGTLFVGHEVAALTADRTFESLYVQPLLSILDGQNPRNAFTVNQTTLNGVFDTSGSTPLQLLVDIKTDGPTTLPYVLKALDPLRTAGYLTTFANKMIKQSAIVVVGTGNSPLEDVKALEPRDYFFNAPLAQLSDPSLDMTWDPTLSPLASTDYAATVGWSGIGTITEAQKGNITKLIGDAHTRGIRARFWDTPGWPISTRNNVWRELINAGADWLNADDLLAASLF
ncbi:hypothetical protein JAAARDRAFT_75927 [Jaapia argillacea MUCL 33604]|uniref:Altered inheritance of mitochondria protein 6 n=1 Tax=Jaapia argillacea MUCL 33604 TaxID=933084 RepID=A0A067Q9A3_9AGAM|nr:hypothetical protein JAAARDRAFT_75927 [Jaapia argillacea MUCL 33604]